MCSGKKTKILALYAILYIYALNIMMKALQELCQIPLYKDANNKKKIL
jgi:hypothetical protein